MHFGKMESLELFLWRWCWKYSYRKCWAMPTNVEKLFMVSIESRWWMSLISISNKTVPHVAQLGKTFSYCDRNFLNVSFQEMMTSIGLLAHAIWLIIRLFLWGFLKSQVYTNKPQLMTWKTTVMQNFVR